jgi:hypothetical protein
MIHFAVRGEQVGVAGDDVDPIHSCLPEVRHARWATGVASGVHDVPFHCQQALRATGDVYGEANCLSHLGDVHDTVGAGGAARRAWTEALDILGRLGHLDADQVRARLRPPVAMRV